LNIPDKKGNSKDPNHAVNENCFTRSLAAILVLLITNYYYLQICVS